MKNTRRFTLIELLAVVALIAILSAIGFGSYSYAKGKAREAATESLMKQIEAGLENFRTRNGFYPSSGTDNGFHEIKFRVDNDGVVIAVTFDGSQPPQNIEDATRATAKMLIYRASPSGRQQRMENEQFASFTKAMDMEVVKSNLNSNGEVVDAWGNKIYYRAPGTFKPGSYDLVSAGSDGLFSKSDNNKKTPVNSTDEPGGALTDYRENSGERLCDDIFNF